jgi:hypothetical protein
MTEHSTTAATSDEDAALAPPPDALNPALIEGRQTFIIVLISAALFIGAVYVFIL